MNTTTVTNATEYRDLPLAMLTESTTNPRRIFEENALKELAETIRSQGVLSPLLVRPTSERSFEIVFGARRYRAAQLAEVASRLHLRPTQVWHRAQDGFPVQRIRLEDMEPLTCGFGRHLPEARARGMLPVRLSRKGRASRAPSWGGNSDWAQGTGLLMTGMQHQGARSEMSIPASASREAPYWRFLPRQMRTLPGQPVAFSIRQGDRGALELQGGTWSESTREHSSFEGHFLLNNQLFGLMSK
jgi:hypothetical protein